MILPACFHPFRKKKEIIKNKGEFLLLWLFKSELWLVDLE